MTTIQQFILENFNEIQTISEIKVSDNLDAVEFTGIEVFNKHNLSVDLETYMEGLFRTTGITEYSFENLTIDDEKFDAIDYINDNFGDAMGVLQWYLKELLELQNQETTIYTPSKIAA